MSTQVSYFGIPRHGAARRPTGWLRQASNGLGRTVQTIVTRRYLAEMDDRMLADVGISRAEAEFESARAPWDTAPRRRR